MILETAPTFNYQQLFNTQIILNQFVDSFCLCCPIINYRLVTTSNGGTLYSHDSISLDDVSNIVVETDQELNEIFWIEGYYDDQQFLSCKNLYEKNYFRYKISVAVNGPCSDLIVFPFASSMEIALELKTEAGAAGSATTGRLLNTDQKTHKRSLSTIVPYEYLLLRTEDILDSGNVRSTAEKDQVLFSGSLGSTVCPIEKYVMMNPDSSAYTDATPVALNSADIPDQAYLKILQTQGFTQKFKLRGKFSGYNKFNSLDLTIVVCGEESVALVDSQIAVVVNELDISGKVHELDSKWLASQFSVTSLSSTFCDISVFSMHGDSYGTTGVKSLALKLQSVPEFMIKIDLNEPINELIYLQGETKGLKSNFKKIFVSNCRKNSIELVDTAITELSLNFNINTQSSSEDQLYAFEAGSKRIQDAFKQIGDSASSQKHLGEKLNTQIIQNNFLQMGTSCMACPLLIYQLTSLTGEPYTHSSISINLQNNIEVKTDSTFKDSFYIEGYFNDQQFFNCQTLFKSDLQQFKVSVTVDGPLTTDEKAEEKPTCQIETLSPTQRRTFIVRFNSTDDKDQTITLSQIQEFFGSNRTCPITTASLYQDSSLRKISKTVSNSISINTDTYLITILNNIKESKTFVFVIKAKTDAQAYGIKIVQIVYGLPVKQGKLFQGAQDLQTQLWLNQTQKINKISTNDSRTSTIQQKRNSTLAEEDLNSTANNKSQNANSKKKKQDVKLSFAIQIENEESLKSSSNNFYQNTLQKVKVKIQPVIVKVKELTQIQKKVVDKVEEIVKTNVDILAPAELQSETPKISIKELKRKKYVMPKESDKSAESGTIVQGKTKENFVKKDIKMEMSKFTPNGEIGIDFNQNIHVPYDFTEKLDQIGRLLQNAGISVSQINANDMFGVYLLQKSNEHSEDMGYAIRMTEWTEKRMAVKVDFQNSLSVSRGLQPDQFYLTIKDPNLFVSKETGEPMLPENLQLLSDIPRQVPSNINATQLLEDAQKSLGGSMNTWIVLQLVAQRTLKGSMDDLLSLYFAMQIQIYMMKFQFMQPASSEIYMNQYSNLIEFKILNPQAMIKIWYPEFDLKTLIVGAKQQMEYSKDERESILDEMFIFMFLGGVFFFLLILAYITKIMFQKFQLGKKIEEKLLDFKKKFIFNGVIRSFSVSFVKLGIASSIQIMMLVSDSPYLKEQEKRNSLIIFSFLVSSIAFFYIFIWFNGDMISTPQFVAKYGELHKGIHLRRNKCNKFYFPNFLLRRFIFFFIPIVMINYPSQQLQAWMMTTVLYIIYFDGATRFTLIEDNILNGINDFFCLIQIYHFMTFTQFNPAYMKQFQMGFSMVIFMTIMLAINVGMMIFKSVKASRRLSRLKEIKKRKVKAAFIAQEQKEVAKTFDISNGMKEALQNWKKQNNWQSRKSKKSQKKRNRDRDLSDTEIEVKVSRGEDFAQNIIMEKMRVAIFEQQEEKLKKKMVSIKEASESQEETVSETAQIIDQLESHDFKIEEKIVPTPIYPKQESDSQKNDIFEKDERIEFEKQLQISLKSLQQCQKEREEAIAKIFQDSQQAHFKHVSPIDELSEYPLAKKSRTLKGPNKGKQTSQELTNTKTQRSLGFYDKKSLLQNQIQQLK